jgi:hypothetical protein
MNGVARSVLKHKVKNMYPTTAVLCQLVACAFWLGPLAFAQSENSAKAEAPVDFTGYWVTIITPDWRERMITPAKGDYLAVPITLAAQKVADAWDPAKDEAAGEQCKSYGAPGLMATPTRLHITWQDDNTLKVETDYGMQTRLFHFGNWKAPGGAATWQGDSVATWEISGGPAPRFRAQNVSQSVRSGSLKIVTTHVRPGYLRKNGIPYSANVKVNEYWDLFKDPRGIGRIMITLEIEDPEYLYRPWFTTLNFKQEPDKSKWDPTPCSSRW